ncbi:MAG: AMP-binding protein [Proteobacteria bacterium]|nr:AMP-binding protein [Pseudomonadota bacterium]MCL2308142.1 AMP-binding protein [Pseudomonadota bacterium]
MNPVWLDHYPEGVPATIEIDPELSLDKLFDRSIEQFAERPAYSCMGRTITFRRLDELSAAFAAWLQSQGITKGSRVALMMPNILQYPVCLFALLRIGAIVVNVNPLYKARELQYQLNDSGAEMIVVAENFAHTLEKVLEKTQVRRVILTTIGEEMGFKGLIIDFVLRHVTKKVESFSLPNAIYFTDVLNRGRRMKLTPSENTSSDIAFLQYTGGTTGVSKGAILTHGNLVANLLQVLAWVKPFINLDERQIMITPLPLYHVFSMTANCLLMMAIGAESVLITNPRNIRTMVREIGHYKFSIITGVNSLFNALLNNADFRKLDFSNLRVSLGGAMALHPAVCKRWREVTGTPLSEGYGLSETSPGAIINRLDADGTGSIGLPLPSTEVVLRDEKGNDVGIGEVGEICIRGPQVTRGYWKRPDETERAKTADGFFLTGDMAVMDECGRFTIVDRKKDMILVSGFNVYPNEVEAVALTHPSVLECAAIGIPDERTGEVVKLFVVKRSPTLTSEELIQYCRVNLAAYKIPRQVEFRDELPKNTIGKVLRRELRQPASEEDV